MWHFLKLHLKENRRATTAQVFNHKIPQDVSGMADLILSAWRQLRKIVKQFPRKKGAFTTHLSVLKYCSPSEFHILSQKKVMALLAIPLLCQLKKQMIGNLGKGQDFKAPIGQCRDQHLCHSGKTGCDKVVSRKLQNWHSFLRDALSQFLFKTHWSTLPTTLLFFTKHLQEIWIFLGALTRWGHDLQAVLGSQFIWQLRAAHVHSSVTLQTKVIRGGGYPNYYTFDHFMQRVSFNKKGPKISLYMS